MIQLKFDVDIIAHVNIELHHCNVEVKCALMFGNKWNALEQGEVMLQEHMSKHKHAALNNGNAKLHLKLAPKASSFQIQYNNNTCKASTKSN